jgi:hypothetical protein
VAASRRLYDKVANTLKARGNVFVKNDESAQFYKTICLGLAVDFKADNPRFDQDRFLTACGLDPVTTVSPSATTTTRP